MMSGLPDTPVETQSLPLLPLRDVVVFPHMVIPLFVGRPKSIKALETAMESGKNILLVAQKSAAKDEPVPEDMYEIGCLANILQMLKLPDGTVKVLVEGVQRARVLRIEDQRALFVADVSLIPIEVRPDNEVEAMRRTVLAQFDQYVKLNKKIPPEVLTSLAGIEEAGRLADTIAAHLPLKLEQKQEVLEVFGVSERLEKLLGQLEAELDILQVEKRIRGRVKRQMEKSQREYYLNEQVKAIQKELGEGEEGADIDEMEKKIKAAGMSKEALVKVNSEVKKLKLMSPMSAEATVVRNYIETLLALPWKKKSRISKDLSAAEKVLDRDHYGLEKVKERIVEYLAVQQRVDKVKAPILCLVGPPGVGKTSLGQSIAKSTNRKFIRMALGGVRDEAEIRGHRRTYIGSMPGKILQNMTKVGVKNPLFLLDEVDKMGQDFRGDPSSALLEVLDPEQNHTFQDHYIEVDFDLSDVMFVATANTLNIPAALLDRLEVIRPRRLHGGREGQHRLALPGAEADEEQRHQAGRTWHHRGRPARHRALLLARGRRPCPGARDLEDLPQGGQVAGDEGAQAQDRGQRQESRQVPWRAPLQLRHGRKGKPGRSGDRPGLDRSRWRTADHRNRCPARQGQDHDHRQAGRGDAGVDPGGLVGGAQAQQRARHRR
jgi:ATP-dependent Lon protease